MTYTNTSFYLVLIFICIALSSGRANSDPISARYEIELIYPLASSSGVETGQARLAIFVKYPGAARSDRTFSNPRFDVSGSGTIEMRAENIPIRENATLTTLTGELQLEDGGQLFLPVRIVDFESTRRHDIVRVDSRVFETRINAFRNSYPFTEYNCSSKIENDDLEKIVIASRSLLTERAIYLTDDESWNCITRFLNENAYILNSFSPERMSDALLFLSEFRSTIGDGADERFLRFYTEFLNIIVNLRILGTRLNERQYLVDHIRSEFTELYSKHSHVTFLTAGQTFESLSDHAASETCLDIATSLYRNIDDSTISYIKDNGRHPNSPYNAITFSMVRSVGCAIDLADDDKRNEFGDVVAAAIYLQENYPEFLYEYNNLYDRLDESGVFVIRDQLSNSQTRLVTEYYNVFFQKLSGSKASGT